MAGEKQGTGRKSHRTSDISDRHTTNPDRQSGSCEQMRAGTVSYQVVFLRHHALTLLVFLLSLFFIITITNPAIYMNDEWITANQLHQLDIGHQVTLSEGKYGVTQNGTVSAYFTSRQNVLMYSLALPVAALPFVKIFGLFGDNFRLIVILLWSLCLILAAFLLDTFYPAYSRIRGIRILFPVLLLALLLFMGNILLYKQFPFTPPDAPFEVAALVLTNQVFFALLVSVVFRTLLEIQKNVWMALFGTLACISCSSYIFWAGTAKDHILTALVFSLIIYCFIRYLLHRHQKSALAAFILSGILVWVRPEIGFFVTIILGLFFIIPLISVARSSKTPVRQLLLSAFPAAGVFIGAIPFFINNTIISHNWLIPSVDLPRDLIQPGSEVTVPLPLSQVATDPTVFNQTGGLTLVETFSRVYEMVMHNMVSGITFENLVRGFIAILTFPENNSIGFLVMCPLVVIGIFAFLLWRNSVLPELKSRKEIMYFVFLMVCAVFFSYMTKFNSMNISHGIIPDMRYLSPAYVPCGLLSICILAATPVLKKPDDLLKSFLNYAFWGCVLLLPLLFYVMFFMQPFGNNYPGYATFFKFVILILLAVCLGTLVFSRIHPNRFIITILPYLLVLVIITVLSFQIMLTSFYGMLAKVNGYPFWIPLVREGVRMFFEVRYMAPV
jgi:hypothetical protein